MGISVVILTFNSEKTIGLTLKSAGQVSDDIHVVDSFSNDKTLEIVRAEKVSLVQHPFHPAVLTGKEAGGTPSLNFRPWEDHR